MKKEKTLCMYICTSMHACICIYIHCGRTQECSKVLIVFAFFIGLKCHSYALSLFLIYIYVYDLCVYWAVSGESVV